jgi:effector-binding domain-containing protein
LSDHKADVQTQVERRSVISNIEFKYKDLITIIELNFEESAEEVVAQIRDKSYFNGINESYNVVTLMSINYCQEESNINKLIHIKMDKEAKTEIEGNFELKKDGTLRISRSKKFLQT